MLETSNLFSIPEDMMREVPCQVLPDLYVDPALDIDIDDEAWISLPREAQFERLASKQAAEQRAVAACGACPLIEQCAKWAMEMGQDVFGVVGGLTQDQRPNHETVNYITDPTERGPLGQVRDDLIQRWTEAGLSTKEIANRLGCNVRTVERRRKGLQTGKTVVFDPNTKPAKAQRAANPATTVDVNPESIVATNPDTAAKIPLIVQRVTPETAAIFDALVDGGFRDRNDIVEAALTMVPRDLALKAAPTGRTYADEDAQVAVGARKLLMNRIDISIRRGRMHSVVTKTRKTLICLEEETANAWREYRSSTPQAA
jgi:hypothetical protein